MRIIRFKKTLLIICIFIFLPFKNAYCDFLMAPADFYPNKGIRFEASEQPFIQNIEDILQIKSKKQGHKWFLSDDPDDYILQMEYAAGCGTLKPIGDCKLGVIWTLYRHDYVPAGMWQAYYPLWNIQEKHIKSRFANIAISQKVLDNITDDILKVLGRL